MNRVLFRCWILLTLWIVPLVSRAEWVFLPESRHARHTTWGLFIDGQSTLINYGQARVWTALGGTMPIAGSPDTPHHPELVFHGSANAALHYNDNFRLWTETLDARLGFAFEWEDEPSLRFSLGYTHFSGHTADGLSSVDQGLVEESVGQEFIPIRIIKDVRNLLRIGATFKPVVRSFPSARVVWFDQFVEYFPWGAQDSSRRLSPYIALGLEEWGMEAYTTTFHAQVGAYLGNHFSPQHQQTLRLVLGYSTGADPRLKYFEVRAATMSFGYAGLMFDL